jgi:hypothetical protein
MGDNLIVVQAEFSTFSHAVFVKGVVVLHRQARPHLEMKTRPRFCPINLSQLNGELPGPSFQL